MSHADRRADVSTLMPLLLPGELTFSPLMSASAIEYWSSEVRKPGAPLTMRGIELILNAFDVIDVHPQSPEDAPSCADVYPLSMTVALPLGCSMTVEVVNEGAPPNLSASCDRSKERQIVLTQQLRLAEEEAPSAGKILCERGPGRSLTMAVYRCNRYYSISPPQRVH